jgi:hypothetical protein
MGAVTYPDASVQEYIKKRFIAVRFNVVAKPEVMDRFNASWTPTIIVEDARGREHRRSVGYLDPKRFLGELARAWLKDAVDRRDFAAAEERLPETEAYTQGDTVRYPETLYWGGMVAYKASVDVKNLAQGWKRLLDEFPDSEWAKRAEYVRP